MLDEDVFLDRLKELERTNLNPDGGERGVRRIVLSRLLRACHGVPPENEEHYKSLVASTAYERRWSLFCAKLRYVRNGEDVLLGLVAFPHKGESI